MLTQKIEQKLLQKLSPQQIQLIKLLEVPTIQLEQRIKKEIEENPALEEGSKYEEADKKNEDSDDSQDDINDSSEEFSLEDYIGDDDELPDYKLSSNNYSKDDKTVEIPFSQAASFNEFLLAQLGLRSLSEEEKLIASYIIGNIDDSGYLRRKVEAIVDDLAFLQNVNTADAEVKRLLKIIQDFDPAGVGAVDLQECLFLQINRKLDANPENQVLLLAKKIINSYFNEFTKKHYSKITTRLNISDETLKKVISEIIKLNPKPGSSFGESNTKSFEQIIPDFILHNEDGELQLSLNSKNAPELRVNRTYAEMLETFAQKKTKGKNTKKDKDAVSFVKQKLDSAKWFIDAIKQRQNTLIHTMNAIIRYQHDYFTDGDETKLRPMILKDIAEITGLDISTISRVANSKYIQTHFGIYALKYFFSEGMLTQSGEEVSTREIKKILDECIDKESKKKPLTDEKLSKILEEKGYKIARRTVAKYREQLGIPVARLRKEL